MAAFLQDEVVQEVGHAQWVFTVPKMLRAYFLHHRELLGALSLAAYQTVEELMAAAAVEEKGFRPGVVSVVQTFGDRANFHPNVHALVSRGGWTACGSGSPCRTWMRQRPRSSSATRSWLSCAEGGCSARSGSSCCWRGGEAGFSVHNRVHVPAGDRQGLEALVRYMMRPPVSLSRLRLTPGSHEVLYAHKNGHDEPEQAEGERIDAMEFVARVLVQIPDPRRHLIRYYASTRTQPGASAARPPRRLSSPLFITQPALIKRIGDSPLLEVRHIGDRHFCFSDGLGAPLQPVFECARERDLNLFEGLVLGSLSQKSEHLISDNVLGVPAQLHPHAVGDHLG